MNNSFKIDVPYEELVKIVLEHKGLSNANNVSSEIMYFYGAPSLRIQGELNEVEV